MVWYEDEVQQLETKIKTSPFTNDRVVFYGSSSIRLWSGLQQDFPQINSLNLGFGGSTLAACTWFLERLIIPANPTMIVFYAGDNDLGDGRHPEEVYLFFCAFVEKIGLYLPNVPVVFLSIKLSIARWTIKDRIYYTNKLIANEIAKHTNFRLVDTTTPLLGSDGRPNRDCFEADGLHLSAVGYRAWQQALQEAKIFNNLLI